MKFRMPRFLRSEKDASTLDLIQMTLDILEGSYVPLDAHTARVQELLDASNKNMELRRKAEKVTKEAELQTLRAVRFARQNVGIVRAVDWLDSGTKKHGQINGEVRFILNTLKDFVAGFSGENDHPSYNAEAFQAGRDAKRSDIALTSAARSVGITETA